MAHPARWREELRSELVAALVTVVAFFLLSITTSLLAWRPDNVSALRLGGALLLGVMLRRQPGVAASALYLLPGLLAMVISQHIAGRAWLPAVLLGSARLLEIGSENPTAMMCAEAVWWRCHRRIVSDYLLARGNTVLHIVSEAEPKPATLTPGAVVNGKVLYPPKQPSLL